MTNREKFDAYMAGFRHGAGCHAMNPVLCETTSQLQNSLYEEGYIFGQQERRRVEARTAKSFGVKLSVIKAA